MRPRRTWRYTAVCASASHSRSQGGCGRRGPARRDTSSAYLAASRTARGREDHRATPVGSYQPSVSTLNLRPGPKVPTFTMTAGRGEFSTVAGTVCDYWPVGGIPSRFFASRISVNASSNARSFSSRESVRGSKGCSESSDLFGFLLEGLLIGPVPLPLEGLVRRHSAASHLAERPPHILRDTAGDPEPRVILRVRVLGEARGAGRTSSTSRCSAALPSWAMVRARRRPRR